MQNDPGRVLVVDDNEMNRDMLSRRLQRRGHHVVVAEDGRTALDLVDREPFDLVLLDIMMPEMDGLEVLRRIRLARSATELPVIMATAKDSGEDVVKALQAGANDYVTKPLDFPVVLARVGTQLSLKRAVDRIVALEKDLEHRNAELEQSNRRMKRDLEAAAVVQRALLPTKAPQVSGVGIRWVYRPCDELAGDILNVAQLDDRHVCFYLLDVSGHGVCAALLSVTLSRVLSPIPDQPSLVMRRTPGTQQLEPTPPSEVAAALNRRFQMDENTEQYFTLFYAVLDVTTHELTFVCAAHPGPVHISGDNKTHVLNSPAYAIGWFEDTTYEDQRLRLQPGDRLFLCSDGVNEATNGEGKLFGEQRIVETLLSNRDLGLGPCLERLLAEAEAWRGSASGGFDDDVSAMAIEIDPARGG